MGQVAIDLPDPLHNPEPAPGPSADDLLAQLAGEEIDRLLAEADVERPTQPSITPILSPATSAAPDSPIPSTVQASNVTFAPSAADPAQSQSPPEPTAPSKPIAEADVEELDARVAQELNNLFTELDSDEQSANTRQPAPAPVATPAAAPAPTAIAPTAIKPAASTDPVAQAHELEKQLLSKTLLDALGGTAEAQTTTTRFRMPNLSFLLRPLEWLNAPLAACSDTVRESLGKVAIMTLINALGILLYVLFLRRH
jgi:hypothetical protein